MDEKTVNRNLYSGIILLVLCLLMCIAALLLRMVTLAILMAALTLLQAYFCCIWLHRKRHPKRHFERKKHNDA